MRKVLAGATYATLLILCSSAIPASTMSHAPSSLQGQNASGNVRGKDKTATLLNVDPQFNRATMDKVDMLVRKKYWNPQQLPAWGETVETLRPKILGSTSLIELSSNINEALGTLRTSHTRFLTENDETFYFLHCLFGSRGNLIKSRLMDFTGAITGGVTSSFNTVRYILDDSPAMKAGIHIGDEILTVNGKKYLGQLSFQGTAGCQTHLAVKRNERVIDLTIVPIKADAYKAYLQAIKNSVKIIRRDDHVFGYIHYLVGAREVLETQLKTSLKRTEGLILDLRDGYGAAGTDDLDFFYRPQNAYPEYMRYSKPVVALINGGTRSGKEAIAFSLKNSRRAVLVGERTAGAYVGGQLFELGDRIALYLAVHDGYGEYMGKKLEGNGVEPDVDVEESSAQRGEEDLQYDKAIQILQQSLAPGYSK